MRQYCEQIGRSVHVINLDPAAEHFEYPCSIGTKAKGIKTSSAELRQTNNDVLLEDISDLVTVSDVMDELEYGPNGGLMYCLEYLADNLDWFREKLGDYEEDYIIVDCPGQIELYSHSPVMKKIIDFLARDMQYKVITLHLLDSNFVSESSKFVAGTLMCLASMVHFEMPHLNILTKVDLLGKAAQTPDFEKFLEVNVPQIFADDPRHHPDHEATLPISLRVSNRFTALSDAIGDLLEQWNLVNFLPLNIKDESSITEILAHIDNATQYGEGEEPKEPEDEDMDEMF